jgi:hypothetical protein
MSDGADPVLEMVAAVQAAGVIVTPIGDELERRQFRDMNFSDAEVWRLAASRGQVEDGEARSPRAHAERPFAPWHPTAPGYPPARPGGAHAGAVGRN